MNGMISYIKANRLGVVTITFSLLYMFLGLPAQVWKIWVTQSAADISPLAFGLLAIQSVFWVLYGLQKKDWFIVIPNVLATLFSSMIIVEYFMFK